ncbi:uncharacterized protein LACBIDRAFT_317243 [Laccaria bicolor S238N-H82]|uniref:Predicted protein n=1 Tax=Laccaria bicolor (strain S238N-H82 / ATCC MYA-4686) TaxID=486041 RepID=B0D4R2_LACBS|nr:uncharacterized protein LACBIDRAFT_317243 [Laccaria bicolor S238N-H82]EDR10389.1 predicted protein [Laccaria bicolor S238N-H82]|eukprot:XP_001878839.1 predicted protein [Laccaria bicolor S238N-H82]
MQVELWIRFDFGYRHALSIPVHECRRFSLHPLTWLRFLGYALYGKEGYISYERDGEEVADYRPEGVSISPRMYYYISQDKDYRLLDPNLMNGRTSYTSDVTNRRANFRDDVVNRDRRCVVTGAAPAQCQACHIVPHATVNHWQVRSGPWYRSRRLFQTQYMKNLVDYRQAVVDPLLDDVNDTRNGILLNRMLHTAFGTSQVAFLQLPNFAMNVNDVPLAMQSDTIVGLLQFAVHPSLANSRLTFHNFSCSDPLVDHIIPHNSAAAQANNDWPPPFLFGVAYGSAALEAWGVKNFVQFSQEKTKDFYYRETDDDDDDDDDSHSVRGAGKRGMVSRNKTVRTRKADRRSQTEMSEKVGDSEAFDMFDVVAGLWAYNARKDMHRARIMKEQTRESIQNWLQLVE